MTKDKIRREKLLIRDELTGDEISAKSRVIFEKVTELDEYRNADNLLIYASMRSEVITDELILDALSLGKRVFCPKVTDKRNGKMLFVEITSLEELEAGYFGIREPGITEGYKEPYMDPEKTLIILPGAAFDKDRNRVGYGGGFYDRYLMAHRGCRTVAISFECQMTDDAIENQEFDLRPDLLITEENNY